MKPRSFRCHGNVRPVPTLAAGEPISRSSGFYCLVCGVFWRRLPFTVGFVQAYDPLLEHGSSLDAPGDSRACWRCGVTVQSHQGVFGHGTWGAKAARPWAHKWCVT